MSITELIEQLKAMPEKMEGCNSEGEIGVINTHKLAEELKKSLRNCDVGTAEEQGARHSKWCRKYGIDGDMEVACAHQDMSCTLCALRWAQMPYEEGGATISQPHRVARRNAENTEAKDPTHGAVRKG